MPNINDRFIKSLKAPVNKKHQIYWDDKILGFGIRITENGAKSFILRYVINGKERKYTIGKYPDFSATAAKDEAIALRGEISKGNDPLEKRQDNQKLVSFGDFAGEFMKFKRDSLRDRTLEDYDRMLKKHILPKFGKFKIDAITRKDIENFHLSYKDRKHLANRCLQLISAIYSVAINWGLVLGNPAQKIKKFKEEKRQEFLDEDQSKKLLDYLDKQDCLNADVVKIALLTGSRKSEVLQAKWCDFDLKKGNWFKDAKDVKQEKSHIIPLNNKVLEILKKLKKNIKSDQEIAKMTKAVIVSNKEYLFFNPITKKVFDNVDKFWFKCREELGLEKYRFHDLRHSFASFLVNKGYGLEVIGKLVGHSNVSTTQRYAHLVDKTLREATQSWDGDF